MGGVGGRIMTDPQRLEQDRLLLDSLSPQTDIVCGVCLEDEQDCECASQAETGANNAN